MARKKTAAPQQIEPEDENQDAKETKGGSQEEYGFASDASRRKSKTDAIRAAVAEGIESPGDGVDFIRNRFGLEMSKGHFSATKSKLKSADAQGAKRSTATKAAAERRPEPVEDDPRPPEPPAGREGDLLDALEAMKPLVASLGKEQAHRIIELLG